MLAGANERARARGRWVVGTAARGGLVLFEFAGSLMAMVWAETGSGYALCRQPSKVKKGEWVGGGVENVKSQGQRADAGYRDQGRGHGGNGRRAVRWTGHACRVGAMVQSLRSLRCLPRWVCTMAGVCLSRCCVLRAACQWPTFDDRGQRDGSSRETAVVTACSALCRRQGEGRGKRS